MKRVKYLGPYGAIELDGLRLEAGAEPMEISEKRYQRVLRAPGAQLEVDGALVSVPANPRLPRPAESDEELAGDAPPAEAKE